MRHALAGGLLLLSTSAASAFDSGNDLYKFCQAPRFTFKFGLCVGLVTGYYQGMLALFDCKADGDSVTREQLVDVVMKYLRDNPGERHLGAQGLVTSTFVKAFDCTAPRTAKGAN
jgi:Rap1a immunity proteins